jgi:para-aminobenzoate synthetase component I
MKSLQPWYWRSLPLQNRTGSEVFAALFLKPGAIATLLESPYPSPQPQLARYSICAGVPRTIDGLPAFWTPQVGEILPFLRQLLSRGKNGENVLTQNSNLKNQPSLPFMGGWLGWLGYDLAWEIERLPQLKSDPLPFPVAYWYEPECFAVLDHWEGTISLAATEEAQLDSLQNQLEIGDSQKIQSITNGLYTIPQAKFCTSQTEYEEIVRQAKKYIKVGDIFQANLSLRFEAAT